MKPARAKASVRRRFEGAVLCAYAERAAGPGWANSPVWVIVRGVDGKIRQECLQPQEQSRDVLVLYGAAAAVHGALTGAVERWVR